MRAGRQRHGRRWRRVNGQRRGKGWRRRRRERRRRRGEKGSEGGGVARPRKTGDRGVGAGQAARVLQRAVGERCNARAGIGGAQRAGSFIAEAEDTVGRRARVRLVGRGAGPKRATASRQPAGAKLGVQHTAEPHSAAAAHHVRLARRSIEVAHELVSLRQRAGRHLQCSASPATDVYSRRQRERAIAKRHA